MCHFREIEMYHFRKIEMCHFWEIKISYFRDITILPFSGGWNFSSSEDWNVSFSGNWIVSFSRYYNTSIFGRLKFVFSRDQVCNFREIKMFFFSGDWTWHFGGIEMQRFREMKKLNCPVSGKLNPSFSSAEITCIRRTENLNLKQSVNQRYYQCWQDLSWDATSQLDIEQAICESLVPKVCKLVSKILPVG